MRERAETGKARHTDIWLKKGVSGIGKEMRGKASPCTRERIAEERDECHRFAVVVVLKVGGTLREESGLI